MLIHSKFSAPAVTFPHRRLQGFVGTWVGVEKLFSVPWRPEESDAKGILDFRMGLGDTYLILEYRQLHPTQGEFAGMCLYGWSEARQVYTMHWFDAYDDGGTTHSPVGHWNGDALIFSRQFGDRRQRFTHRLAGDRYIFLIESSDGDSWQKVQQGEYRRA